MSESGQQQPLRGALVALRPWRLEDAHSVFAACQDDQIQRWVPVPSPYTHADAVAYVSTIAPEAWADGGAVYAVVDDADRVAGAMGAHSMTDGVAHVGYWTAASARGRGYTTDALRTITTWFFRARGAARVELVVEPANVASIRVAEKAGFRAEGLLRQRYVLHERRIDVVMYSMLPDEVLG